MLKSITRSALLLALGFTNLRTVSAYSTGFNIPCLADGQVATTGHGSSRGTLANGATVFKVGDTTYTADDVVQLPPNTKVTFNILNDRTEGIFFRLSAKDGVQDVTAAFQPVDAANTMVMATCVAPVAGVVHSNKNLKPTVSATFDTTGFTGEFSLQITNLLGFSEWYYSPFNLVISTAVDTPAPTDAPVSEPTKSPVVKPTKEPASEPTKLPVSEPTKLPVSKPTKAPVAAPVSEPKPTKAPVEETKPTKAPVEETKPTKAPVEETKPTKAPEAELGEPTISPTTSPTTTNELPTSEPTVAQEFPTALPTPGPKSFVEISKFLIAFEAAGASKPSTQEYIDVYEFTLQYLNQSFAEYFSARGTNTNRKMTVSSTSSSTDAYPDADKVTAAESVALEFIGLYGVVESYDFVSDATFNILFTWTYLDFFFEPIPDDYLPSPDDLFTALQDYIDGTFAELVAANFKGTPFENVLFSVASLITTDQPSRSITEPPAPRSPRAQPTTRRNQGQHSNNIRK